MVDVAPPTPDTTEAAISGSTAEGHARRFARPHLWLEILIATAVYEAYARVRDWEGAGAPKPGPTHVAREHGLAVLHTEQALHIDIEKATQNAVLGIHWLVKAVNGFYGGAHFAVTVLVFFGLLLFAPRRFPFWRNVLAIGTVIGIIGFALWPTMPPRLLHDPHYVDTLSRFGGLWSYDHGSLEHISDPYAAMPSLHIVWAGWCAAALASSTRRWWLRALAWLYPITTCFVVLASANHYLLDLVAGAVVLAIAYGLARLLQAWLRRRSGAVYPAGA